MAGTLAAAWRRAWNQVVAARALVLCACPLAGRLCAPAAHTAPPALPQAITYRPVAAGMRIAKQRRERSTIGRSSSSSPATAWRGAARSWACYSHR
jgi:hypothetical protein